ncbi:tRNA(Ile)-lysidine synthase [Seinonella peptonophila]|uniref:tRNA(Ile)-lysidine synthase n=1 Tax=Seinonella peptonophila TaxID=112248 RepID=A0A1M4YT86_9BACL|nr:tRNA lysidine(34) synthetase TilS [Seinonella peptonophila]SHF08536.1 tRNA(Ile)-lysidine synthase [Seinonella peptonophila]
MFLDRLQTAIREYSLIDEGERVLVGVSGGPDSIALLHGLHQLREIGQWSLFVIHVNHSLRGEESDQDARYVTQFCQQRQIPCHTVRIDVSMEVKQKKGNLQAVARELRYEQFRKVAKQLNITKLALAHHADDQVETLLMRLLRGTGIQGLSGIHWTYTWQELTIVRPLLAIQRQLIEAYCDEQKLFPRFDSSNESLHYTRNRIRKELVPLLLTYNPRVKEAFIQLSQLAQTEEEMWQSLVAEAMKKHVKQQGAYTYRIHVESFLHLPVALQRRVVKLILNCLVKNGTSEVSLEMVEQVRKVLHHHLPSVKISLPHGLVAYREYESCLISMQSAKHHQDHTMKKILIPGVTKLPEFDGELEVKLLATLPYRTEDNTQAVFDADQMCGSLFVRSRRPGDRMYCQGMKGRKRLKDLLMEAKIPAANRDQQPIVTFEDEVIWVPGVRCSKIAAPSSKTRRYLYLTWRKYGKGR